MESEGYTRFNALIPVAEKPPTQPAMPPTKEAQDRAAYEQKKAERRAEAEDQATMERRAKALELATTVWLGDTQHRVASTDLFEVAATFLTYIETGERPA